MKKVRIFILVHLLLTVVASPLYSQARMCYRADGRAVLELPGDSCCKESSGTSLNGQRLDLESPATIHATKCCVVVPFDLTPDLIRGTDRSSVPLSEASPQLVMHDVCNDLLSDVKRISPVQDTEQRRCPPCLAHLRTVILLV